MRKKTELRTNLDWAGVFRTVSERLSLCKSEEQMFRTLQKFKEDFNTEYKRWNRTSRRKDGFRWKDGEE